METEIETAVRLLRSLQDKAERLPISDEQVVAVIVFRYEPEIGRVHSGWATNTTETLLKRWLLETVLRDEEEQSPDKVM